MSDQATPAPPPTLAAPARPRGRMLKAAPLVFVALLAVAYVGWRVAADRPAPLGPGNPHELGRMQVRNQLYLLADEINHRLRSRGRLPGSFREAAPEILASSSLREYSLYLAPEEAVHGPGSRMPRQGALVLDGPQAPKPSFDWKSGRYELVAVRWLGDGRRVEAWKITSAREIGVGQYELTGGGGP